MTTLALLAFVWLVLSAALGLLLGAAIRLADHQENR